MKSLMLSAAVFVLLAHGGFTTTTVQAQGPHIRHVRASRVFVQPVYVPHHCPSHSPIGLYGSGYHSYEHGSPGLFSQANYGLFNRGPSGYSNDQANFNLYLQWLYSQGY